MPDSPDARCGALANTFAKEDDAGRMRRCSAVAANRQTHQIGWVARCQNTARHVVDGIPLCGVHFNAGFRGEIEVVYALRRLTEDDI